ncbi:exopolysaccharide biosynthesis polyprenyl glycosylphosphotransferase [Prosthecomicrobium sp. N25]|uniref:exopolysaccharide biosynthesis polyprenyl glycosylphosphotransferase n=1 Tax=Prosthecomicrobium sp. N25 TaxID=3129254 RepID=UPI0030787460
MVHTDWNDEQDSMWAHGPALRSPRIGHARELLQLCLVLLDAALIVGTGMLAQRLAPAGAGVEDGLTRVSVLAAILFAGLMGLRGAYGSDRVGVVREQLLLVATSWLAVAAILVASAFLFRVEGAYRTPGTALFLAQSGMLLAFGHGFLASQLSRRFKARRASLQSVVVILLGHPGEYGAIRDRLAERGVAILASHIMAPGSRGFARDCLVALQTVRSVLAGRRCDSVLVFGRWREERAIDELVNALSPLPVPVILMADPAINRVLGRRQVRYGAITGYEIRRAPLTMTDRLVKRGFDAVVAGGILVMISPLLAAVALAILVETGRPILFAQDRRGFGGKPFRILKFRSMTVTENGPAIAQAQKGDKRVTPLGAVLRKTSLDELPQLINVLKGEMSIVGPRPHALAHDDQYDDVIATYAYRQHVKPGITGWAQVNGHRGETREIADMEARVEHDLWYINNWSPWLDVKILGLTALKVWRDDKAY